MKNTNSFYASLSRNMMTTVIAVSFAPLVLVVSLVFMEFSQMYSNRTNSHFIELVQKHQQDIDSFLDEKLRDIRFVSATLGLDKLSDAAELNETFNHLQEQFGSIFVDLGVVDSSGLQIAYAGPYNLTGADYADAHWYREAVKSDQYISDVFMGLREAPHFIIAVKAMHNGKPWILRATIDFDSFSSMVESIHIGETGTAYILNRQGVFQTQPPALRKGGGMTSPLSPTEEFDVGSTPKVTEVTCESGEDYLMVSAPLKGGDWQLVYRQKTSDALSALIATERSALIIFMVGGIGIIAMAVILTRKMVRRIRNADQQNERMNRQIVETGRLAAIGELAAGIAHEINNPVAIMIEEAGWMEDLLNSGNASKDNYAEYRRALFQIRTQGGRCKNITHKLLRFARKSDVNRKHVNPNEMVSEIIGLFRQGAGYANIKVTTRLTTGIPNIDVSVSEMQQVLLNLVNNALQAMEEQGGELELSTTTQGRDVIIAVTDTGPGIAAVNMDRIFDPFFTTKPVGKGTGLGLSICYGIISRMGGRIEAQSVPGEETTFSVRLPAQTEKTGQPSPQQGPSTTINKEMPA